MTSALTAALNVSPVFSVETLTQCPVCLTSKPTLPLTPGMMTFPTANGAEETRLPSTEDTPLIKTRRSSSPPHHFAILTQARP